MITKEQKNYVGRELYKEIQKETLLGVAKTFNKVPLDTFTGLEVVYVVLSAIDPTLFDRMPSDV